MAVKEWKGDIVFLHEVIHGAADRSYGIHVAKIAGLPKAVINRAKDVLDSLEQTDQTGTLSALTNDLPLFNAQSYEVENSQSTMSEEHLALFKTLEDLEPDNLTPREALDALYRLKSLT